MPRKSTYAPEFRAKMAADYLNAPSKTAFVKHSGIGAATLHRWAQAAKARRGSGRPPRRTSAPAPVPALTVPPLASALIAYSAIDDALMGLPAAMATSVLAAQLRRRGGAPES